MKLLNTSLASAGLLLAIVATFLALQPRSMVDAAPPAQGPSCGADMQREIDRLRAEVTVLKGEMGRRKGVDREHAAERTVVEEDALAEPEAPVPPRELLELGRKVIARTATEEESTRFWRLARTKDRMDELLDLLSGEVNASPRDVEARLRLADAYVMKLFTVPAGPEMALWGAKACDQWREVLEIEPDHWKARFSIAVSLSYHPDFAGKGPEAIRELECLVEQQASMPPEPCHADVYRLLAQLHARRGDRAAAEKALRTGLDRHPDDAKLKDAMEAFEK